jgi:photosystem II stability/assembly factor-like uncharacterized protein
MIFSCDGKSPTPPNQDSWVATNSGLESLYIQFLAVHPVNSNIVFAGTWDGLYRSANSGQTWARVDSGWAYAQISAIAFEPLMDEAMYAGTSGAGVMKSEDGGESWESRNVGLPDRIVWCIATDPQYPDTLFVGTDSGIYRSYDGADTLSKVHWYSRSFIAINSQNPQIVYAGGKWNDFYKSVDGGQNWQQNSTGIPPAGPEIRIQWVLIDPLSPRILYAASNHSGVHKSTDAALNWTDAKTGLGTNNARVIALDFSNPDHLYVATNSGVFQSTDGAGTWQQMNEGLTNLDVRALAVDPLRTKILYAGTWGDGVFVWKGQ